jgi:hypothetical protein
MGIMKAVLFHPKKDSQLGEVAHSCNPSYLGGRDQEIQGQAVQKVSKTLPQPIATWRCKWDCCSGPPGKNTRSYLKNI